MKGGQGKGNRSETRSMREIGSGHAVVGDYTWCERWHGAACCLSDEAVCTFTYKYNLHNNKINKILSPWQQ